MTWKRRVFGVGLAVALALAAMVPMTASAAETHSGSASGTTYYTVDQHVTNVIHTPAGDIKCTTITGHGKTTGTTSSVFTITGLAFDSCTAFGLTAHIDTMGCVLRFFGVNSSTGILIIECPTTGGGVTDEITVTPTQGGAAICHINIGEQGIGVNVSNTSSTAGGIPDDIDFSPESTDWVEYIVKRTAGGSKCPTEGGHSDGVATGSLTVTAFQNEAHTERVGLTYT